MISTGHHSARALRLLPFLLSVGALAGCAANPYAQFYVSALTGQPPSALNTLIPNAGEPQVYSGSTPEEDRIAMIENGYYSIGYASFSGPPQDVNLVKTRARELKAAIVLIYSTNQQTVTNVAPVVDFSAIGNAMSPKTETTRTSGTVYGSGGSANYFQTSTKTVPQEQAAPQTMTYTTTLSDQMATFWVKAKPLRLGVSPRDLTADERAARGSNKGVMIYAVEKGSPAYVADFLRGDIITKVGDVQIMQSDDLYTALDRYAGTEVDVVLEHKGITKTVRVTLNPTPR